MDKISAIYSALLKDASLGNIYNIFSLAVITIAIIVAIYIFKKTDKIKYLKLPIFFIILLDLYVYSFYGTGFKGNIKSFDYSRPANSEILAILEKDRELFRILPFDLTDADTPNWAKPNANIIYGLDSIAAYTPLAIQNYKKELSSLEVVDDSLGLLSPSDNAISQNYQLLRLLNVKYIVSARKLDYGFLKEINKCDGIFLYRLENYLPRIFFTQSIEGVIEAMPPEKLNVLKYSDGFAEIEIVTASSGFLVFSESYYDGWKAFIDGIKTEPVKVRNLVQAVKLDRGKHLVIFRYNPFCSLNKR